MRLLEGDPFDGWRDRSPRIVSHYGGVGDEHSGAFVIPPCVIPKHQRRKLFVIASAGAGWDHVSVSVYHDAALTPTWDEMVFVKRAFFYPHEWAIEYHPPVADNISVHPGCLHIWRPQAVAMPVPEAWMVG